MVFERLKNKEKLYTVVVSLLGMCIFATEVDIHSQSLKDWVLVYILTGSVVLLNLFPIILPPKANSFSMDSAVYLATLFLYGLNFTLQVLFIFSLIELYRNQRMSAWRHLFNFSMYCLMISGAYYSFLFFDGNIGKINVHHLLPYLISLLVYFSINVLLIFLFFYFIGQIFKGALELGVLKEACVGYSVTLLLSMVLAILLSEEKYFGLSLFIILVTILSIVFRKFLELYQLVSNRANRDHLTGLYNHGFFKETLKEQFSDCKLLKQPLTLAFLDLDDFKKYNDRNGHLQGDRLLAFFGKLLQKAVEGTNFTVARYGGEEFAILMPNTTKEDAYAFLNRLRKEVNDTYFDGVEHIPYRCLSFSCGIAEMEKDMHESDELIHRADQALYYAKAQGKNNVQLYDKHNMCLDEIKFKQDLEALEQQVKFFLSKDVYTYRHSKRVFKYALEFGSRLDELTVHERQTLALGAIIHDIGKIEVPRDILNKSGKLEKHEWEIIQKHVAWGREIVAAEKRFDELLPLVELHHERYDGKGYPYGLKGEEIPKLARILCIIDSFDAMTTERPYQPTKTFEEALEEIERCAGTQFDPVYAAKFVAFVRERYLPLAEMQQLN
ncbi:diguanylate cyclase [Geobacillus thermodenitrificans]|jgi:diguanylate cyclase (GGDEF)-like protein|uniref:bifunctional diguanylate cyclase/phosphohydrolase n=2 Tax=Anoxybacillaceae TaxID=3120669 RepID=UPI000A296E6B|nr:diguanylate cyclase [Geobacillus thermodenitrificans]ARP42857.1 putative diguanylate cyclase AdrA [Geobacillus thermodenitrificans]ATO35871.1 HD family phosphohydrolase [Geobacillus thermodenitrificans]